MAALCTRISTDMLQPFAKPFCAAHFPLAAALLVVVAESLRCAGWRSASAKLVHGNGGLLRRKPHRQGADPVHLVRLGCRFHWCVARPARINSVQMLHAAFTQGQRFLRSAAELGF